MNYYGAKELAGSFRTVRKNTIIIAEEIGEEHYGLKVGEDTRTVAQVLTHIALAPRFQYQIQAVEKRTTLEGFNFQAFIQKLNEEEQNLRSKQQIVAALREEGEKFATWLEGLSEEFLGEQVGMPPGAAVATKSRFEMILGTKEHEMHHRGQLMLVERMLGIVPHLTRDMQARFAARESSKASA
jgi:uncharacterized damage-inducible protein DinB